MTAAPHMPVFVDVLISDTTHLSTEEFGAYCLLLFRTWSNNGKPLADIPERMARVCRVSTSVWKSKMRPALVGFFDLSDGTWRQKRLEKEWGKVGQFRTAGSIAGKASAAARALKLHKPTSTIVDISLERSGNDSPTPIPIKKEEEDSGSSPNGESPAVLDIKTIAWQVAIPWLVEHSGRKEAAVRSIFGTWCRDYSDGEAISAVSAAQKEMPVNPISWIERRLKGRKPSANSGYTPMIPGHG